MPLLSGEEEAPETRTLYFPFVRGQWAIRHGGWKLLSRGKGDPQLFDLSRDPNEEQDLAKANPTKVEELTRVLAGARELDPR